MTVIAANEVASRAYKQGDGQFIYIAGLIGRPGKPNEGPQALHVHQPPPMVVGAHFHKVNQWQLVIAGSGAFGHHRVDGSTSVLFHYTDHDTPYGPITAEADGISYLTLRAHSSGGIWYDAVRLRRLGPRRDRPGGDRRPLQGRRRRVRPEAGPRRQGGGLSQLRDWRPVLRRAPRVATAGGCWRVDSGVVYLGGPG